MPIQVVFDRNIINNLNAKTIEHKILPILSQGKLLIHLAEPFLQEIIIDGAVTRRARHSKAFNQIFNGKMILSMKEIFKAELEGRKDLFFSESVEDGIRQLLNVMAQGRPLNSFWEDRRQVLIKKKKLYDADFKIGQEVNLKNVFRMISQAIKSGLFIKRDIENLKFEHYYEAWTNEQKLGKLHKILDVNEIAYKNDEYSYLDKVQYPRINLWLRSWYAYHHYTTQRWQPTLRKNDATDLNYICCGYCVDHFITNDKMLLKVGNVCYGSVKFITWKDFESNVLSKI